MKNLLTLTFRYYAALAGLLWLLSVPISFLLIQRLVVQDVDEALLARKTELTYLLARQPDLIKLIHQTDPDVQLLPGGSLSADRLYDTTYYLPLLQEWEPHRELATSICAGSQVHNVLIRQSLVERADFILAITGLQTGIFLLLLLGLGIVNRRMTRQLWQPFTTTLHRIRQFRLETDPAPAWDHTEVIEFDELHQALSTLIARNKTVYQSQREFTENASHELQTPVAVISAELELLYQSDNLSDADLNHVHQATAAIQRLAQLNKALLLLTQIENQQFTATQSVDLSAVVTRLMADNRDFIEHKQLTLEQQGSAAFIIEMNLHLADVLLGNLLRNAIRHTPMGGTIRLSVTSTALLLANSGPPLPFPPASLFYRFVKNPALPEATGLGLSIAQQIATLYQLQLNYAYDATGQWHQFRLERATPGRLSDLHQY